MTASEAATTAHGRTESSVRFIERVLAERAPGKPTGLLLGKLDALNRISTTFGKDRAEAFCADYVDALGNVLPAGATVMRLSNRRFAVVLMLDSTSAIMEVAARVAEDSQPEIRVVGDTFLVDVTVGVAVHPTHASNAGSLFRRADLALRQARENGLTFEIYEPETTVKQAAMWKFESELDKAVAQGALEVYYQPKLALREDRVCGVEALVRWRHESGRLVGPDEFIPLAERTGSVIPISWLVFDAVVRMRDTWAALGGPFSVAVNISPQVLCHVQFFDRIAVLVDTLSECGAGLTLEVTENSLLESDEATTAKLTKLKQLGVELAIDDFGKGHSALTYLKHLPADELKIDKHFVGALATDEKDRHIVEAVISLAHAFGMRVVAEGVDNEQSLDVVGALGCEYVQGFYFSRPIRADLLHDWIASYGGSRITRLDQSACVRPLLS